MNFEVTFIKLLEKLIDTIKNKNIESSGTGNGIVGTNGVDGQNGKSAFDIWKDLGNVGTEQDFINSFKYKINTYEVTNDMLRDTEVFDVPYMEIGERVLVRNKTFPEKKIILHTVKGKNLEFIKNQILLYLTSFNDFYEIERVSVDNYDLIAGSERVVSSDFEMLKNSEGFVYGEKYYESKSIVLIETRGTLKVYKLMIDADIPFDIQSKNIIINPKNVCRAGGWTYEESDYLEIYAMESSSSSFSKFQVKIITDKEIDKISFKAIFFGRWY